MIQGDDTDNTLTQSLKQKITVTIESMIMTICPFTYFFNKYVLSLLCARSSLDVGETTVSWKNLAPSGHQLPAHASCLRAHATEAGKVGSVRACQNRL